MVHSIPLLTLESRIKRQLRCHLKSLGFQRQGDGSLAPPCDSKAAIRETHRLQREERLAREGRFVDVTWPELRGYFASGIDVEPQRITPRLEIISGDTWQSRLFRLASLTWSVPVSQGYGRRMRFLVWDDSNGKLIGLIGLGDPVFNLKARDQFIDWDAEARRQRLANVLDAFVLGALPPYNMLLGGKLVACLVRTREMRDAFAERYAGSKGLISRACYALPFQFASRASMTVAKAARCIPFSVDASRS